MSGWKLSKSELKYFQRFKKNCAVLGKPMVLWGWKRDKVVSRKRQPESRTVYFSADLNLVKETVEETVKINRAFFFWQTRAKSSEILALQAQIGESRKIGDFLLQVQTWKEQKFKGYSSLQIQLGEATDYDQLTIQRRLKGKPRITIAKPQLVAEDQKYDLADFAPFALCLGSGVSAESGLPLLGSIHNLFEVDNVQTGQLIFGSEDHLPIRIVQNVEVEFESFCEFTIQAIKSRPSKTHNLIAKLYHKGIIRQVLTDNMDDILDKVNVPYTSTRLSIFPDRFPVKFDPKVRSLLVIGVAVDRRDVIKQARKKGLKIIVINPVMGVAPHSRNMDYLRKGDIFFRQTAKSALPKIIKQSKF